MLKKWTVSDFWVIGDSKKALFWKKSGFLNFFIKLFLHTFFFPKTDFLLPDHLFWIADNS